MSNVSLIRRLEELCRKWEQGQITLRDLSANVESHTDAIEGLPFDEYKNLKHIAHRLWVEAVYAEEGCESTIEPQKLVFELRTLIARLPVV